MWGWRWEKLLPIPTPCSPRDFCPFCTLMEPEYLTKGGVLEPGEKPLLAVPVTQLV